MTLHFGTPGLLWLLAAVPLLMWWWLWRRRVGLRHPVAGRLAGLPAGRARLARWGGAGLRGVALALVVTAVARPVWPDERTRIETESVAVVMVVDVSSSMGKDD